MTWRDDAACRPERLPANLTPLMFFPHENQTSSQTTQNYTKAKAYCRAECPVLNDCYRYARKEQIDLGIWGGRNMATDQKKGAA